MEEKSRERVGVAKKSAAEFCPPGYLQQHDITGLPISYESTETLAHPGTIAKAVSQERTTRQHNNNITCSTLRSTTKIPFQRPVPQQQPNEFHGTPTAIGPGRYQAEKEKSMQVHCPKKQHNVFASKVPRFQPSFFIMKADRT